VAGSAAIGAAFAGGVAGLGTFLVLGFTLHNVTEGIGIVAPLSQSRPPLRLFAGLALLAGAPAILGIRLVSCRNSSSDSRRSPWRPHRRSARRRS
jgi:zinc transporter ZupT